MKEAAGLFIPITRATVNPRMLSHKAFTPQLFDALDILRDHKFESVTGLWKVQKETEINFMKRPRQPKEIAEEEEDREQTTTKKSEKSNKKSEPKGTLMTDDAVWLPVVLLYTPQQPKVKKNEREKDDVIEGYLARLDFQYRELHQLAGYEVDLFLKQCQPIIDNLNSDNSYFITI